jgi:MFS family permease
MATSRVYWSLVRNNADFRRLYVARLISFAGDWFLVIPLLGLVYESTGSSLAAAGVLAAQALPALLLAPVTGAAADRLDRRRILVVSDLIRAGLVLSLLGVDVIDGVWFPLLIIALEGAGGAFFYAASSGALPNVVSEEELAPANVLMSSAWGAMLAVGAALGGFFAAVFSRDAAFIVNAASFVASAALVARIGRHLQEPVRTAGASFVESTRDALRYAFAHRPVLALLTAKSVHALTAGGAISLFAVISFTLFDSGDAGTGVLFGARGLGNLFGPIIAFRLVGSSPRRLLGAIGYAMALWGAAYVVVGVSPWLVLAALMIMIGHMGGGTQFAFSTFGLQELCPDQIRGRVFALDFGLDTLAIAMSALVVGALADTVSLRLLLVALGVIALVFGLGWARVTRSYWAEVGV